MKPSIPIFLTFLGMVVVFSSYSQDGSASADSTAAAPRAPFPSVADVIRLTETGTQKDVVIADVNGSHQLYNLSADDIVSLQRAGVSSDVIAAMLTHDSLLEDRSGQRAGAPQGALPAGTQPESDPAASAMPRFLGADSTTPPTTPFDSGLTVVPTTAPPPRLVEVEPTGPGPGYGFYWVPGHWIWSNDWVWIPGGWHRR